MDKLLILFNCFFNVSDIERTIISIIETKYPCDIIFLENPSKYSYKIRELAIKYKIYKHYICTDNIEGNVWQIFYNKYKNIIENYKYIALSEADVVLDKGSLHESMELLSTSPSNVGLLSIDLHMDTTKYYNLPICSWVPNPTKIGIYSVGGTGFQFIIFKQDTLNKFITSINKKELICEVALGIHNYFGISDSNLTVFTKRNNLLWIRTTITKLDHIGWEHYILNNDEYTQEKEKNIKNGKIRNNIDIHLYDLIEL
jgi:hypothetical protein